MTNKNPLLAKWNAPYKLAPFDKILDGHFSEAVEKAIDDELQEIQEICENPDPPTFENTIHALLNSGKLLERVLSVFYNLVSADSNSQREKLMMKFSPKLALHSSTITSNEKLFSRIREIYEQIDTLNLLPEEHRLLEKIYRDYVRAGAALDDPSKERMKDIKKQLSILGTKFSQNLLADERSWHLELSLEDQNLLPDFLVEAASKAADAKGIKNPIITLSRSIITPFLKFSPNRKLRKQAQQAWVSRGMQKDETDNRPIAREILALRRQMAVLLGYRNFAEFKLDTEMAKKPENVEKLLLQVWGYSKKQARIDQKILTSYMAKDNIKDDFSAWDWQYYSEKRRQNEHQLNELEIKPYFGLDQMIGAAFYCANKLFDLSFTPIDLPLYHKDCRAWEVSRKNKTIGLFIGDYFARPSKRSGAWCSAFQSQAKFPTEQKPIVLNVCNFAKGSPSLLSFDDAQTLFHEFGHALHQLLSNVMYEPLSGTSVSRDFVELPSQLYEHWLTVSDVLKKFALHYETKIPISDDLIERIIGASNYDSGFQTVEYTSSALVDLYFHLSDIDQDVMNFQTEILNKIEMPEAIEMRHATPHFAHIFSGDYYAAAYYSYMWSEVLDEDVFSAFGEAGNPFDEKLANSLEKNILSRGNSIDPELAYIKFRGKLPKVDALLKGRGLV
ncbi:M3 family metallopeptidase [Paracoccaceae bacterium]|nr:M3 family metallopeptidase [Paracoccaceae bacterium]